MERALSDHLHIDRPRQAALPAAGVFCLLWSSAFAVSKIALADCPPLLIVSIRLLGAGVLTLVSTLLIRLEWRAVSRRDLIVFTVTGVLNSSLYLGLNLIAMQKISAGLTALIASANPVLTATFATFLLDERMTWRKASGLVLSVGGVAYVVWDRVISGTGSATGIACVVSALMALVAGTILFKKFTPSGDMWIGNGIQNLSGGLAVMPFAVAFESFDDVVPTWRLAGALAFLTILVSIFGYFLWSYLIATVGATAASAYHFLMPPLGLMFGWLLLGEHVAPSDMIGAVPIVLGIYLITRRSFASPPPGIEQFRIPR